MKIGIVGAGAIGGWIGVSMSAQGHDVCALARGETLRALRTSSWRLRWGDRLLARMVHASDNPTELGVQDIVILSVKTPALPAIAPTLKPLLGPETVVISAMNGLPWWFLLSGAGDLPPTALASVDRDGAIAAAIPLDSVLGCVVHASVSAAEPGCVVHKNGNRLIIGEPRGGGSARVERVAQMLRAGGFDAQVSRRIHGDIWYKLWGNMTMNPISALTGATCDRILDDELVNGFVLRVMAEAAAIGQRLGCEIRERGEDRNKVTRELGAFRTSMLRDVDAGRALELDSLLQAPSEVGRQLHMQTPNIDALLGLARLFARTRGLYPEH